MNHIEFWDKKLAFESRGEGAAVVLIHGFGEDSSIWASQISLFEDRGYRLILPDLPGFGASEAISGISIAGMAQALRALLAELSIEQAILLGHSMGGYVALAFLEQFPEQVQALGLIHSHAFEDTPERKQARAKSVAFIREHGTEAYLHQLIPALFPPAFAEAHPEHIHHLVQRALKYPPEGICTALEAMSERPDLSRVLELSEAPVLFVLGMEDALVPATEAMLAQTGLPDLALVHLFEGIGHMSMFEAPERLRHALGEFLHFLEQQSPPEERFHHE